MAIKCLVCILMLILIEIGGNYANHNDSDVLNSTKDKKGHPFKLKQISMKLVSESMCGGALLNDRIIITAAYCVHKLFGGLIVQNPNNVFVVDGSSNEMKMPVKKLAIHPEYNENNIKHDIAMIFLEDKLKYNDHLRQINLPTYNKKMTQAMLTEFTVFKESDHKIIQEVNIQIPISNCSCDSLEYHESRTGALICASDLRKLGRKSCSAISGSPLVVNNTLYGIAAAGISCNQSCNLAVFTNVWDNLDWILVTSAEWEIYQSGQLKLRDYLDSIFKYPWYMYVITVVIIIVNILLIINFCVLLKKITKFATKLHKTVSSSTSELEFYYQGSFTDQGKRVIATKIIVKSL